MSIFGIPIHLHQDRIVIPQENGVLGQLIQALLRGLFQDPDRIVPSRGPQRAVQLLKQVAGWTVPGPPKIVGELLQPATRRLSRSYIIARMRSYLEAILSRSQQQHGQSHQHPHTHKFEDHATVQAFQQMLITYTNPYIDNNRKQSGYAPWGKP